MIAIPNCCLIRAAENYVVDPGVVMQGAPVTGALRKRGIEPHETKVILTHTHFDHVQALIEFTQRETYVHEIELQAALHRDRAEQARHGAVEKLTGEEGEIEPGVRWIRTPGHSDGLISLLVDTDDGLVVIASDCVGPLPEYFENLDLPQGLRPERRRAAAPVAADRPDPHTVVPGHNPPVVWK